MWSGSDGTERVRQGRVGNEGEVDGVMVDEGAVGEGRRAGWETGVPSGARDCAAIGRNTNGGGRALERYRR